MRFRTVCTTTTITLSVVIVVCFMLLSPASHSEIYERNEELLRTALSSEHTTWNISNTKTRYHLITMLSLYCGHIWEGYKSFTIADINDRDKEYLRVLESNINHPLVEEVHLFFTSEEALNVIRKQKWKNAKKILPVKTERRTHMMDFFHYASKYLIDKPVIAANGDIIIGEGFDLIDTERMRDEKVMYTLTRHGIKENNCTVENYCLDRKYQGSHDTHIFRLAEPLDDSLLVRLDFPINMWQAENAMIGAFKFFFNFHVHNPCRVIKTYHHHCSPVHRKGRTYSVKESPYNWPYSKLAKAYPTDQLLYKTP